MLQWGTKVHPHNNKLDGVHELYALGGSIIAHLCTLENNISKHKCVVCWTWFEGRLHVKSMSSISRRRHYLTPTKSLETRILSCSTLRLR